MKAEEYAQSQRLWNMLSELGFDALPSDIEEVEHFAKEYSRNGFGNWLYAYTFEKICVSDAKTIYDFLNS